MQQDKEIKYLFKDSTEFVIPQRRIFNNEDLKLFCESSQGHQVIWSFITRLDDAVIGIKTPPLDGIDHYNLDFVSTAKVYIKNNKEKEKIAKKSKSKEPDESIMLSASDSLLIGLFKILDMIRDAVYLYPPIENSKSRFGNPAFVDYYNYLCKHISEWHTQVFNFNNANEEDYLPIKSLAEIGQYLCESFGNPVRIDYGSGHELNFISWLICFDRLGLFKASNDDIQQKRIDRALVLRVFVKYLSIMRLIQATYWLEPAGSHGVWGLDDYHFLPYLFGSSQLQTHKHLKPISIHDDDILEMFYDEYLYFNCVLHINKVKTSATLRWHSPMLDDISGVKSWKKVSQGMKKMYLAEVLNKLPIMQHFKFGTLIQSNPQQSYNNNTASNNNDHHLHDHNDHLNSWASCCGIKVPSAIAVAMSSSSSDTKQEPNIVDNAHARPLPFD